MSENHNETIFIEESSDALMKKLEGVGAKEIIYLARITDYRQSRDNVIYGGADVLLTPAHPAIFITEMIAAKIRELLKNASRKEDEEYDIELNIGRLLGLPDTRSLVYVECDNDKIGLCPWPIVPLTALEKENITKEANKIFKDYKEN